MNTTNELTAKQFYQFVSIANETQSVLPHDEVAIIEILKITVLHCTTSFKSNEWLKEKLEQFKSKYYCHGFKPNKAGISGEQYRKIWPCRKPRFAVGFDAYKPFREIEKVAFMKALRACRDYIRAGFTDDAFNVFAKRLDNISLLVR